MRSRRRHWRVRSGRRLLFVEDETLIRPSATFSPHGAKGLGRGVVRGSEVFRISEDLSVRAIGARCHPERERGNWSSGGGANGHASLRCTCIRMRCGYTSQVVVCGSSDRISTRAATRAPGPSLSFGVTRTCVLLRTGPSVVRREIRIVGRPHGLTAGRGVARIADERQVREQKGTRA
jgi:hypothetical protein